MCKSRLCASVHLLLPRSPTLCVEAAPELELPVAPMLLLPHDGALLLLPRSGGGARAHARSQLPRSAAALPARPVGAPWQREREPPHAARAPRDEQHHKCRHAGLVLARPLLLEL